MSIATVVGLGFGAQNLIATLGFGGAAEVQPHGVIRRRGKLIFWESPEEVALEATTQRLESLIDQQALLRDQITRGVPNLPDLRQVKRQLERRMRSLEDEVRKLKKRLREEQLAAAHAREEFEDVQAIAIIIEELYG